MVLKQAMFITVAIPFKSTGDIFCSFSACIYYQFYPIVFMFIPSGVWDYIANLRDTVSNLESRVQKAQANIKVMDSILASWVLKPIFERKDGKKDALLNLEDREERLKKVYVKVFLKSYLFENSAYVSVSLSSMNR